MKIELGSMVKVTDLTGLTADQLRITEEEFQDLIIKVEAGECAVVFDFDEDNDDLVDIVFEDGMEVFFVPSSRLILDDDDEEECFCPRLS